MAREANESITKQDDDFLLYDFRVLIMCDTLNVKQQ